MAKTAILLTWFTAQTGASEWLSEETISGHFIGKNVQTQMWIGRTEEFDAHIRHEDGPPHTFFAVILTSQTCRDSVTGLDNLLLRVSDGRYSKWEYWYVDPPSQSLELAYRHDFYVSGDDEVKWITTTGECRWRDLENIQRLQEEAFAALGVTSGSNYGYYGGAPGDSVGLPFQEITDDSVHHSLALLTSLPEQERVRFNLAAPSANEDAETWLALKITSLDFCGPSVLLVQDRDAASWHTVHTVEGEGYCGYQTTIDEVHVIDDNLIIRVCYECGVTNTSEQVVWLEVNPRTNRAVIVDYDRPEFIGPPNEDVEVELALFRENCKTLEGLFTELNRASQGRMAITVPSCTIITGDTDSM